MVLSTNSIAIYYLCYWCLMHVLNPLDKLIEAYDENKKLYERLLASEKEKISYLEKLADKK